jgi:uncharacterized membrane protein
MKKFSTTLYFIGATLLVVAAAASIILAGTKLGLFTLFRAAARGVVATL